ncbi:MAG: SDR family oxidoreductase [Castellaniella sp.]
MSDQSTPSGLPSAYRTALVTGASRGIGAAICSELVGLGLEVHAIARNVRDLDRLRGALDVVTHPLDITDTSALQGLCADLQVDVLVNNAGQVAALGSMEALEADAIDRMIDVNLRAPLQLIRLLLPGMLQRGHGHIINIGSTTGSFVFPGTAPYAAAKAGMSAAGRVMRHDLAGRNIRITEISPGRVRTGIYREAVKDAQQLSGMYEDVRTVHPEDIARCVVHALCLPEQVDISFMEVSPTDQAPGGHAYTSPSDSPGTD